MLSSGGDSEVSSRSGDMLVKTSVTGNKLVNSSLPGGMDSERLSGDVWLAIWRRDVLVTIVASVAFGWKGGCKVEFGNLK